MTSSTRVLKFRLSLSLSLSFFLSFNSCLFAFSYFPLSRFILSDICTRRKPQSACLFLRNGKGKGLHPIFKMFTLCMSRLLRLSFPSHSHLCLTHGRTHSQTQILFSFLPFFLSLFHTQTHTHTHTHTHHTHLHVGLRR